MAEPNNRARSALMRNLPKKGWDVQGEEATFKDLTLKFGDDTWTMTKKEGKSQVEVGSGTFGKTQMADVKDAAAKAGSAFAESSGGGGGGGGRQMSEEAKKAMREKRQAAAEARKAEKDGGDDTEKK